MNLEVGTRRMCGTATLALAVWLVGVSAEAPAAGRVALVIGNGAYGRIQPLDNPVNDATLMGETLRELDFDVAVTTDANHRAMNAAVRNFGKRLRAAGAGAVGVFFYAGHGVQSKGHNYLIPLDAPIEVEADLEFEAVRAQGVLGQMKDAGSGLNIVILDACRNNPFPGSSRSGARGLSRIDAPKGSLIAYSASPGQVAKDGEGRNSPYTAALAQEMRRPGKELQEVFRSVRKVVLTQTGNGQLSWEESSLTDEWYFRPLEEGGEDANEGGEEPKGGGKFVALQHMETERAFWASIEGSGNAAKFEAYLEKYGKDGEFAALARIELAELEGGDKGDGAGSRVAESKAAYEAATGIDTIAAYRAVADSFEGLYATLARQKVEQLKREPGRRFRDCETCPWVVVVPPGSYEMGSPEGELGRGGGEGPVHRVTIGESFAVGMYEVTFAQWDACRRAGGCPRNPGDEGWGRGERPVIDVSWEDARAYVEWLSRETGAGYRLPSESEWEYAARGGSGESRYWGEDSSEACGHGNVADRTANEKYPSLAIHECRDGYVHTSPVGSFKANGYGMHDVLGNVLEWVEDCSHGDYRGAPVDGSAWTRDGNCYLRVSRGGSWLSIPGTVRSANRFRFSRWDRKDEFGFRVARTLD